MKPSGIPSDGSAPSLSRTQPYSPLPTLVWPLTSTPVLRRVAADVADWPALIEQARQQNVLGLLASRLRREQIPEVPPEVMAELDRARAASAARALRMSVQLLRLLDLLEGAGIEVMPVKGPTLSQDVYGDPTVRSFGDLDILMRSTDAARARDVLLSNGYRDQGLYNERILRRGRRSESEIPMIHSESGVMVDLHWQLTVGYSTRAIGAERILASTRTVELVGREVRVPSRDDQLLLTALHAARHDWVPLELRLAVALQVMRLPESAWPGLCATTRELGCLRRVLVGVVHACRPFKEPVPAEVARALSLDRHASCYEAYLCNVAADNASVRLSRSLASRAAAIFWQAVSEDDILTASDHLLYRGFLPGPEDWSCIRLPARLGGFYWLVRPPRLLCKHWSRRHAEPPLPHAGW